MTNPPTDYEHREEDQMRSVRVQRRRPVWGTPVCDVPIPDDLAGEHATTWAARQVRVGAWAPWHVKVGDVAADGKDQLTVPGPLGIATERERWGAVA